MLSSSRLSRRVFWTLVSLKWLASLTQSGSETVADGGRRYGEGTGKAGKREEGRSEGGVYIVSRCIVCDAASLPQTVLILTPLLAHEEFCLRPVVFIVVSFCIFFYLFFLSLRPDPVAKTLVEVRSRCWGVAPWVRF